MTTPPKNTQILEPKTTQSRNRNKVLTTEPLVDRGLNEEECKALCTSSEIPLKTRAYFRVIYETQLRPSEALHLSIEDFNKETGEAIARKVKGKKNRYMVQTVYRPRHVIVTQNTAFMLKTIIENRKKGFIFESETNRGKPISKRYMQAEIDKYAKLLSIQRIRQYAQSKKNPNDYRVLPMVTLMALRKAGERHHDAGGGDASLSAQAAGHTMDTKTKYYQGEVDWEAVHKSYKEHHPSWKHMW